jgi:steroid 5-alpha reductase family enzyme
MSILHDYLLDIGLIIWLCMTILFVLAIIRKDNSIVDVFWGLGFVIVGVYSLVQSGEIDLRKVIVNLFVVIWGLRLALHISARNQGKGEDFRYKAWRDSWKWFYLRTYLQIFMLQGAIMLIVSFPIWYINFSSGGMPGIWDMVGLVLFGTGFLMEVIADSQLAEFKKYSGNKGKLMTSGLWSVSRHPNYFGEPCCGGVLQVMH